MEYRREIDGLRALAVLPVILFHAGASIFSGGFVGVDIFFVISGYLITSIIVDERLRGTFTLANFYERRARRILPALFVVLAATTAGTTLWLLPTDLKQFGKSLASVSVYASNIFFLKETNYFSADAEMAPLLHTWSLAVEEQYYLVFPLLLAAFWRLGLGKVTALLVTLAVASLCYAEWGTFSRPAAAFYLLTTRGWELLIGSLAALYRLSRKDQALPSWVSQGGSGLGLALILYAVFAFDRQTPFPSLYTLAPTIGAALVILCATKQTAVGRLLASSALVFVGLISYSAYLWHQPLFALARHRAIDTPGVALMGTLVLASLALAYMSWKFVETPWRNPRRFDRQSIVRYGVAGSLAFIALGLTASHFNGLPERFDAVAVKLQGESMDIFEQQVKACWNKIEKDATIDAACAFGATTTQPSIGLLGDSHAGALQHQLGLLAQRDGISGLGYSFRSCPPLIDIEPEQQDTGTLACSKLRRSFFQHLSEPGNIPGTVIVNARWPALVERRRFINSEGGTEPGTDWTWRINASDADYAEVMVASLSKAIERIVASGRTVILVYPVPELGWDVPKRLARIYLTNGKLTPADASISQDDFVARNRRTIAALDKLAQNQNVIRVRPDLLLCNTTVPKRCAAHIDGESLYFDNNHLSNLGAKIVAEEILKTLKPNKSPTQGARTSI